MNSANTTSELSGKLRICALSLPNAGVLGITHCPGRNQTDAAGRQWRRSLPGDVAAIAQWGAVGVISLLESHEFPKLGVPDFTHQMRISGLRWFHLAIPDQCEPGPSFQQGWQCNAREVIEILGRGERLIIHCAAGLGRSGMIAAKMLTAFGVPPETAISRVREVRPGAIETQQQARYVLDGPPLRVE